MEDLKAAGHVEHNLAVPSQSLGENTIGIEDEVLLQMAEQIPNFANLVEKARRASAFEHNLTNRDAFKRFPKAIAFSFILSLAIIMEGYDTSLLGSFYAYPTFQKRFGVPSKEGGYQVTSNWQTGLQNATNVGQILGLLFAGLIADRWGYKKTMIGALVSLIGFIFIMFFASNIGMLLAGEILCGIPWGAFQTLTTTYAAEVSPIILRPYLTTYVNLCWVTGQFISTGVLRGLLGRTDEWGWRIPYAVQWVWPVPIIIGVIFAPESPWWLVRHGKIDEAKRSLASLSSPGDSDYDTDDAVSLMIITNAHEKLIRNGVTYWDCLKGVDRRRTEIVCCVWMCQVFCGIWYGGNIVYFLQQINFSNDQSFDFGLGVNAIGWCGTVCSWFVMQRVGRRKLFVTGLGIMFTVLMLVGFLGIPSHTTPGLSYSSAALLLVFVFTYDLTVGPVTYCLISEIPSTRLRIKSAVLARNCYNIASIIANFLNPPILNPTAWNLKGKGGFIWAPFCMICFIWSFFRLPEPKGRTASELDVLFEKKISARKFSKLEVTPFRSDNFEVVPDSAFLAEKNPPSGNQG
ncbi:Maltose permease MAL31 [Penicillium rolfsii]|nr:Maltose permease MAL31 [Penicillium rolfsii]